MCISFRYLICLSLGVYHFKSIVSSWRVNIVVGVIVYFVSLSGMSSVRVLRFYHFKSKVLN